MIQKPTEKTGETSLEGAHRNIHPAIFAHADGALDSSLLILDTLNPSVAPSSSIPTIELAINFAQQQNPLSSSPSSAPSPALPQPASAGESLMDAIAYQRADPRPFSPHGFLPQEVQHRELMTCVVMRNTQSAHEDFAIVSISPLPNNVLHFRVVVEVVQEFLEDHMHI
jgi:hypothetical protein